MDVVGEAKAPGRSADLESKRKITKGFLPGLFATRIHGDHAICCLNVDADVFFWTHQIGHTGSICPLQQLANRSRFLRERLLRLPKSGR